MSWNDLDEYSREWEEQGCPECGHISCQGCDGVDKMDNEAKEYEG